MKILIVEDAAVRKEWFAMVMRGHDYFITEHVDVACSQIFDTEYDEIWLDHDLGIHRETGMDVVDCIIKTGSQKQAVINIHSVNTPAAIVMKKSLVHAGYENVTINPFNWLLNNRDEIMAEYQERL